jgi:HK97 family phage prohead protease
VNTFKPPIDVANNAKKAIEWREKYPKETADAGTQVGWTRARQLANRENISEDTIGRMVSFFARHEGNEAVAPEYRNEPWRDNGYLMHLCWGGDAGKTWSNKIYSQIQNNKSFNSMSQIEYKHIKLDTKSFDEIKGTITLKACYYGNIDRVGDILEKGACENSIKKFQNAKKNSSWDGNKVPFLLEHKSTEILAINIDDLYDTAEAPIVVATISDDFKKLQPAKVQDIYTKITKGQMYASIGYRPAKSYIDSNKVRRLQEVQLVEISLTTNPANMKATMIDLKSINLPKYPIDIESSWDGTQAEQRWREYTQSVEMPNTNYKNGFLYFDAENQDNFGAYHLQVVDIVDGEPKINERAVFAVYQAIQGARGGLKVVPENEMPRLQGIVNELYKKINRVRVTEGMEALEMPNFKTKSEFQIALEGIKNADGTFSTVGFSKFLDGIRKGKYQLTQNGVVKFVNTINGIYNGRMPKEDIEKMLDNKNNDVKSESVPQDTVAQEQPENKSVPQNQTFADVINAAAKNFKK